MLYSYGKRKFRNASGGEQVLSQIKLGHSYHQESVKVQFSGQAVSRLPPTILWKRLPVYAYSYDMAAYSVTTAFPLGCDWACSTIVGVVSESLQAFVRDVAAKCKILLRSVCVRFLLLRSWLFFISDFIWMDLPLSDNALYVSGFCNLGTETYVRRSPASGHANPGHAAQLLVSNISPKNVKRFQVLRSQWKTTRVRPLESHQTLRAKRTWTRRNQ